MSRSWIIHVVILILPWRIGLCQQVQLQSEIRFTKAYNCNATRLKWIFQNISIHYSYPGSYMNAILNVTEEAKKIKKVIVHYDRCIDQGYQCEDFQTWSIDNFCTMLNWKNQLWSGLTDAVHPPLRCPIKKMIYQARNATYDFEVSRRWYPDIAKYHWETTE